MKILKIFLLLIAIIIVAFFAEMWFNFLPQKYRQILDNSVSGIFGADPENINQIISSSNLELSTLTERGAEVSEQVQKAFSKAVEPSSAEKPIQDRAFEYGRYLYCQEVVKSYEK